MYENETYNKIICLSEIQFVNVIEKGHQIADNFGLRGLLFF